MWQHWINLHNLLTWLQLIFTCSLVCNQHWGTASLWCYRYHYEWDGRAKKDFTRWLPGMFPTPLQSLAQVYSCLNGCNIFYLLETDLFREHFEGTTYMEKESWLFGNYTCSRGVLNAQCKPSHFFPDWFYKHRFENLTHYSLITLQNIRNTSFPSR
jgi:hypothetical protein